MNDIIVTPLKVIKDERGAVMHMLRSDAPHFKKFGEIYFSVVNSGITKGWKRHKIMEQNFAVPSGNMKFVFVDTQNNRIEISIGTDNYSLITVPAMIWYSFTAINNSPAIIANCATIVHDPLESEILSLDLL